MSNNIYIRLDEFYDSFKDEAKLLEEAKCLLINNEELDNFYLEEEVYVSPLNDGYLLEYKDIRIEIEVERGMIINTRVL